jgi:hypothetical protein
MAKTETADFLKRFRVESGRGFRLKDFAPADTHGFKSKQKAEDRLAHDIEQLSVLQEKLYAQDRWSSSCRRWMLPARTARSST